MIHEDFVTYKGDNGDVKSMGFSIESQMMRAGVPPMMIGTYGGEKKHKTKKQNDNEKEKETIMERMDETIPTKKRVFGSHLAIPIGICLIKEKQQPRLKCEVDEENDVICDDLYEKLLKLVEVKENHDDSSSDSSDSSSDEEDDEKKEKSNIRKSNSNRKTKQKRQKNIHKKTRRK
jgi:hypothetical protein